MLKLKVEFEDCQKKIINCIYLLCLISEYKKTRNSDLIFQNYFTIPYNPTTLQIETMKEIAAILV